VGGESVTIGFHMRRADMYFGRLGMNYDFIDWVIVAGTDVRFLSDEEAAHFGITYTSMR
jgi:uncharacterized SAM-binding protein YcdF (DUF218 family)